MPEWLIPTLSFLGGCAATYFLLRVRFERFEAMDTRREQDWKAWREDVDTKLGALNGALLGRVDRMEREIGTHDSGMRGQLHTHAGVLTRHELDIENLKRRQG